MNPERMIAAGAFGLMLLGVAYFLLSSPTPVKLGKPLYKGAPLQVFDTAVPQIESFDYFSVGDYNPFLPSDLRLIENSPHRKDPPPSIQQIKPYPSPIITDIAPQQLPRLPSQAANAPHCIGLIGTDGDQRLVVTMPGITGDQQMQIKDSLKGWQLVEIIAGNTAHFLDPSGTDQSFPIGDGDLAKAQVLAEPSKDAPVDPKKKDGGGGLLIPKLTDGPGVVAPPVKPRRPRPQNPQNLPTPPSPAPTTPVVPPANP